MRTATSISQLEPDLTALLHALAKSVVEHLLPAGWAPEPDGVPRSQAASPGPRSRTRELLTADYLMLDVRTAGREQRPSGSVVWQPTEHIRHFAAYCVVGSMGLASQQSAELAERLGRIERRAKEAGQLPPAERALLDAELSRAWVALDKALAEDVETAGYGEFVELLVDVVGTDDPVHALRI